MQIGRCRGWKTCRTRNRIGVPVLNWRRRRKPVLSWCQFGWSIRQEKGRGPGTGPELAGIPPGKIPAPSRSSLQMFPLHQLHSLHSARTIDDRAWPNPDKPNTRPAPGSRRCVAPYSLDLVRPGLPSRNLHALRCSRSPPPLPRPPGRLVFIIVRVVGIGRC